MEKRFLNQLKSLHRLSGELAEEQDRDRLLQYVIDAATRLIDGDYGVLTLFDKNGQIAQSLSSGLTPEVRGFLETVWTEGKTVRLDDFMGSSPAAGIPSPHPPAQSLLATRIDVREERFGSLCVIRKSGSFREEDEQLLILLIAAAAGALHNIRLVDTIAHQSRCCEVLNGISDLLNRFVALESVFPDVAAVVKVCVPYDRIGIIVPQGEHLRMAMSIAEPPLRNYMGESWPRTGNTAVEWVLTHGRPRLVRDLALEQTFAGDAFVAGEGIRSSVLLCLPINEERAVLVLDSRSPGTYEEQSLEILGPIASRIAAALQNAKIMDEQRQILENLKATQEQLVRTQSLRAIGELAGGTAHHLNNVLAIILGQVQLLRMTVTDAAIQDPLEMVERAVLDGADTVRRLQAFSRSRPSAHLVPVDLIHIIEDSLELTRPRWQDEMLTHGIRIELETGLNPVPFISGQAFELREAITNLILNAVDAMPHGGRITMKTWLESGQVCLSVSDTGIGMPHEVSQRAFEPFFGTRGPARAGLGLSVVYGIVQRHGGEIAMSSAEGRGTTVTLRFPSAADTVAVQSKECPASVSESESAAPLSSAPPPRVAPSLRLTPPLQSGRILIIDDEAKIQSLLAEILSAQGYTVDQASGGAEGLALLEQHRYDLVITDLGMPEVTGWEVAKTVKTRWPCIRVILTTGWGESVKQDATIERGVDALLCKPFMVQEVRSLVAKLLETAIENR